MTSTTSEGAKLTVGPARAEDRLAPVRLWLYAVATLVLCMVVLGGITRLTDSGLSITEWRPISGILPPLSETDWIEQFEAYKLSSEYRLQNAGMSLAQFETIFWWEWAHRFLGRLIGIAFAVPFVVFLLQRRFSSKLALPLTGLFLLGGFQGALGWWMVSSGLSGRVDVSQYRLAAHLLAAALLFIALIWVARRLEPAAPAVAARRRPLALLLLLVLLQIGVGGFVAGLDAGMIHNTWPLIDGRLIPRGMGALEPFWRNLFENHTTVQFLHRILGYVIALYAGVLLVLQKPGGGWISRIVFLILLQVALGVATLLMAVPIPLALCHQALAFMLAGVITACLADICKAARPQSTRRR